MKGGAFPINLFIFYTAYTIFSLLLALLFAFLLDFIPFDKSSAWVDIALKIVLVLWLGLMGFMTYVSARCASYENRDFEDSIFDAISELRIYIALVFPFLGKNNDEDNKL